MRILFSGDSPTVDTGFGRVSQEILKRLQAQGHEIIVVGVNHYGDPYDQKKYPYTIYPCEQGSHDKIFGVHKFWFLEQKLKPDILFFLNDPWIIQSFMDAKPPNHPPHQKTIMYFPTDGGPLKKNWAKMMTENSDIQICYSKFAEDVVTQANGFRPKNLKQLYHGVDRSTYFPINQSEVRRSLGIPVDAFVVGMVARNQIRKRFDILVQAFAEFAKNKPKAKLYLHTALIDIGFDIQDLIKQYDLEDKMILTKDLNPAQGVSERQLNMIYNTFDVNCLISLGDGFGLPVAESMATQCPQLVSDHSCLRELVDGHGGLTVKTAAWIMHPQGINTWGGVSDVKDLTMKLETLYNNQALRMKLADDGYKFIQNEVFNWDYIGEQVNTWIKEMFHIL